MAIELDVVTQLNERSALTAARQAHAHWERASRTTGDTVQRNLGGGFDRTARDAERSATQMQRAFNRVADASGRVRIEQERYDRLIKSGEADRVKLIQHAERLATAQRNEEAAVRAASRAHRDFDNTVRQSSSSMLQMGASVGALSRIGGPITIAALAKGVISLTGAAAAATGAIGLLPGVAMSAVTAFGSLKLATAGVGEALENMGDPEKFATALRELSPSAQQAVLAIRQLMPEFDRLKAATQDALFAGTGPQVTALVSQYLPQVRQLTTGISGAFNEMFDGLSQQLMTTDMQSALSDISTDLVAAFRNLAPAVAPITQAFTDLIGAGAGFMPALAEGAANAAQSFADFVREARQTGQLDQWISDGLGSLRELGRIAFDVGRAFMAFAEDGKTELPKMADAVDRLADSMGVLLEILKAVENTAKTVYAPIAGITGFAEQLGLIDAPSVQGPSSTPGSRTALRNMMIPGGVAPGSTAAPSGSGPIWGALGPAGAPGAEIVPGSGSAPGGGGRIPLPSEAGGWFNNVPLNLPQGWNPMQQYRDQLQERMSESGGGSRGSLPQAPSLPLEYSSTSGMDASLAAAQNRVDETRHAVAERQARLNQLLASNVADETAIQDARNDVARAEQDAHEAQMRLADAQQKAAEGQTKSMRGVTGGLNELGAALDSDLGVSGGLAGMADNLVRFLGAIALAGPMAHLSAISDARGDEGSGLVGILASTGALGSQFLPGQPTASSMGPSALQPGIAGTYGSDAALLASVPSGSYSQTGSADLVQGLGDCSSAVEDLVNLMDGRPTSGRSMSTGNAAEWLASRGFMPGPGGPGDMRVGWDSGHMEATLPGGTNFNWGSQAAAARGGRGGQGSSSFPNQYYRPAGAGFSAGLPALPSTPAPGLPSSGGGTVPVFVVNMPGGGVGPVNLPIGPGGPAAPTGGPAAPTPSIGPAPLGGSVGAPLASPGALPGLTNPALNNPAAPGAPLPPLGSLPGSGSLLPGTGMPGAAPLSSGGNAYPAQPGGGGIGLGGMAMDGLMAATSGLDMMAPGAGAAAKIGIQLANLGIKQAGKVAGIGISGVFETLSLGDNPMGSLGKSWIGKLAGGLAGARPAVPNAAGAMGSDKDPRAAAQQGMTAARGGDTNISVTNNRLTEDGQGRDIAWHVNAPPGRQG